MDKEAFVWGLHSVRGAYSASNDEAAGFEALLSGLKGRHIDLIVIEATGGPERAGWLPAAPRLACGSGQPARGP
jgi:hypothetical protein